MIKRRYSNWDELSILGFGGILVDDTRASEAERLVGLAIDSGINYFDVAPTYGNAEERLGPALAAYRQSVFLACKTTERDGERARSELESSLGKMRTDYFDLYQLHMMTTKDDFDQAVRPGGALETLIDARDAGKIRHLGFSAHSVECALALLEFFDFDSVLFPINWAMCLHGGFGPQVVEKAKEKGASVLALKAMAYGKVREGGERPFAKLSYGPIMDPELQDLALRFTLMQSVTAALPPGAQELFGQAIRIAEDFKPLSENEVERLIMLAKDPLAMFELGAVI
jgi:predicted aldo/keto reductase-like oxidoreductase